MSNDEVYELEDEFDPLAGDAFEDLEDVEPDNDYSAPVIPDAERSVVPEKTEAPAAERIEQLLKGMPGQQFRILSAVEACVDAPQPLGQVIAYADERFPQGASVYTTGRLVQLLERAGAIERVGEGGGEDGGAGEGGGGGAGEGADAQPAGKTRGENAGEVGDADGGYGIRAADAGGGGAHVTRHAPVSYRATDAGAEALRARTGMAQMERFLQEEPRYIPVYKRILTMCMADTGRLVQEVNAVVNADPICAEPRRYSTYFLRRLEGVGAICYTDAWRTCDYGKRSLELGLLADADEAGDLSAAAGARERQLAEKARFEAEKAERERQAAERAEMEEAQEAMLAAQARARGEEPPEHEEKRKCGSGGPVFAFPYTPPDDEDGGCGDAAQAAEEPAGDWPAGKDDGAAGPDTGAACED